MKLELDLEAALSLVRGDRACVAWLLAQKEAGDPGPVYYEGGQLWTDASVAVDRSLVVGLATGDLLVRFRAAVERSGLTQSAASSRLGLLVEETLTRFLSLHGEVLRVACGVPPNESVTAEIVTWAFIGHGVARAAAGEGLEATAERLSQLLERFEECLGTAVEADNQEPI